MSDGLTLRAPLELSLSLLPGCLASLRRERPDLVIEVRTEARRPSELGDPEDAQLVMGPAPGARCLGQTRLLLCGAPALASGRMTRTRLAELPHVAISELPASLDTIRKGEPFRLPVFARVRVSTFTEAAEIASRAGLAAVLPGHTALRYFERGRLLLLAPEVTLPAIEVNLLASAGARAPDIVDRLAELVAEELDRVREQVLARIPG